MATATITGPDYTMTICSGGYWINIDGVAAGARVNSLPAGSGIDLTSVAFPVKVKLNWHYENTSCNIIAVDAVQKIY